MIDVSFNRVSKRYLVPAPPASRRRRFGRSPAAEEFWAVHDVSFDVAHGETLGIIGHNGAGKSTLLKLMSRITSPTAGEIVLDGRVAALIEVGSGFHPELTGRENVFLSGSILGMRRREIVEKLDRIVAFSGVGSFIDTPVKWYSSGMYVRLGFAIASHLDADILLVDEVLAVGDAAFQIQCHERLNELRRAGTTMLFISHDLVSIEKLCDRALLMQRGRIVASGSPRDIVETYQHDVAAHMAAMADATPSAGSPAVRIRDVGFFDDLGRAIPGTSTGAPLVTRVRYQATDVVHDAVVELFYYSRDGRTLLCQQTTALSGGELTLLPGHGAIEFTIPELGLQPGAYTVGATVRRRPAPQSIDWFFGNAILYVQPGKSVRGYFYFPHEWRLLRGPAQPDSDAGSDGIRDDAPDRRRSHV